MACRASSYEGFLAAATALSIQIARENSVEDLALLGAFFTVLGDQLSLLALGKSTVPLLPGTSCSN